MSNTAVVSKCDLVKLNKSFTRQCKGIDRLLWFNKCGCCCWIWWKRLLRRKMDHLVILHLRLTLVYNEYRKRKLITRGNHETIIMYLDLKKQEYSKKLEYSGVVYPLG